MAIYHIASQSKLHSKDCVVSWIDCKTKPQDVCGSKVYVNSQSNPDGLSLDTEHLCAGCWKRIPLLSLQCSQIENVANYTMQQFDHLHYHRPQNTP